MTAPSTAVTPGQWSAIPNIVFVGFRLAWKPSIGDLRRHHAFAERWERELPNWKIADRKVHLATASPGCRLELGDGSAALMVETEKGFELACKALEDLGTHLGLGGVAGVGITCEAQSLRKLEGEFPQAVVQTANHTVPAALLDRLGAKLEDFAYLVDVEYKGDSYQLSVGILSAKEVRQRVKAFHLGEVPAISRFYSVTASLVRRSEELKDTSFLSKIAELSTALDRELTK